MEQYDESFFCDHNIFLGLKERFYKTDIRSGLLYDAEC